MFSTFLLRVGSEVLHSVMGGMAVFCLYYAAQIIDPDVVQGLFFDALKWGVPATIILCCKIKYLDN